ncbi:hypothetical protein AVEN_226386-1 [Araneus ventricosus]|uniref:Uncharacterized protein n=1 Tax=Araneus ventricosus TaxID=182803 RepID=A0A4Y2U1A5_ARAVE|nr:hypothetical protein AVEN_226386-1 [Araneus ventricosus]
MINSAATISSILQLTDSTRPAPFELIIKGRSVAVVKPFQSGPTAEGHGVERSMSKGGHPGRTQWTSANEWAARHAERDGGMSQDRKLLGFHCKREQI